MKKDCCTVPERMGKVGGQAVLEGVMMKAGNHTVTTCRTPDGDIAVSEQEFLSAKERHKWLNIPILRGIVNFIESLMLSFSTLGASAEAMGLEEEESRFEKWLKEHLGLRLTDVIMVIGLILGLGLSLGLFLFLPAFLSDVVDGWTSDRLGAWRAVLEGGIKVLIFLAYLWLVSLMPDIKRTFMYHGAEHKSIACFEAGVDLTPENAKNYTRFHPRCGTSFMFFMILLGIFAGLFVRSILPGLENWQYILIRLLILPLIVGLGYEFIRFAGKHDNLLVRMLSAPGLWVQRITTREPTEDMLEIAIISLKGALRYEIPEFQAYFDARPWEVHPEQPTEATPTDTVEAAPACEDATVAPSETQEDVLSIDDVCVTAEAISLDETHTEDDDLVSDYAHVEGDTIVIDDAHIVEGDAHATTDPSAVS